MSLEAWKVWVTEQRQQYARRLKSVRDTNVKESSSWPTVTVDGNNNRRGLSKTSGDGLATAVKSWPTPAARDYRGANSLETTLAKIAQGKRAQMGQLPNAVMIATHINGEKKKVGHLNPAWVEKLMGVPMGWTSPTSEVTHWDVLTEWRDGTWEDGISRITHAKDSERIDRIRSLGNGVVPACAALAFRILSQRLDKEHQSEIRTDETEASI
jgi:DNA (cytosine-5)-methyltransferase 1